PGAIRSLWDRPSVATSTGTLVYHAADVLNIIDDAVSRKSYTESDARSLWEWLVSRDAKRDEPGDTYGAGRGKNLVMIQVESLQSFVVGLKVGNVEVTPNINRLVRESVYFPSVYSQTAAGNSSDAELMAHASLYPTAKGAAFMRFARNRFVSLGTELSSMGYSTVALHGDRPGFWNRNHMYPSLGFDRYVSIKDFRLDESIGLGLSDRSFFEQSMAFIRTTDGESGPFFAFLVTLTSHYPFNFKSLMTQTADLPLGEADGTLPGDYVLSISYVDAQIGKFIDMLRDEELLDESVVVLYGDHAAIPRGDHGILSLLLGRDLSSPAAWRAIQSVPLVVRLPRGEFRGERNVTAGQIDIAPTVASVMGFKMPTAMGSNLLDPGLDERAKLVVFRNGSFIRDGIWVEPGRGTAYNMRTSEAAGYSDEMARCAAEAAAQLRFSDMMLEGDMASSLEQFKLRAENK
ncbi:MAG: LTA synthase family protein, partial [Synergistaceae bacterium]|nr:LTA synthase family protein [Synergistaceae bacterium]